MKRGKEPKDPQSQVGVLSELIRSARLTWRLLRDRRVPIWLKAIVPASFLYLLFPGDLVPDFFLGLGQLDDLAIILMGVRLFLSLSPPEIVQEHLEEMRSVNASYRVVNDEDSAEEESGTKYVEGHYRVVDEE